MKDKPLRLNKVQDDPWPMVIMLAVSTGFTIYLIIAAILSIREGNFFGGLLRVIVASVLAAPVLDRYR